MHPLDGLWRGKRCFVLGGGPSLKGVDLSFLQGERVIAVNWAINCWLQADILYGQDVNVWSWVAAQTGYKGLVITSTASKLPPDFNGLKVYAPNDKWSKSFADGLPYCYKSGTVAINIAEILGADPIYLLGYDATGDRSAANFNPEYTGDPRGGDNAKHIDRLTRYAHNDISTEVVNLNIESKIECFNKLSLDMFLTEWREGEVMNG